MFLMHSILTHLLINISDKLTRLHHLKTEPPQHTKPCQHVILYNLQNCSISNTCDGVITHIGHEEDEAPQNSGKVYTRSPACG